MTGGAGAIMWLVIAIALLFAESITAQLVSIWFGVGALVTMIFAFFGASTAVQLTVFLIVSVVVMVVVRPFAKEKLKQKKVPTNADRVIGMTGIVTEEIDNRRETGRVLANGLHWTARATRDDLLIPAQEPVTVIEIDGVKLIVEPSEKRSVEVSCN